MMFDVDEYLKHSAYVGVCYQLETNLTVSFISHGKDIL